jgi:hypothetical protein
MNHPHKSTTHEERFFHILPGVDPLLDAFFTSPNCRFSGATAFVRREDDGNWYFTAALCSKLDQYCRRIGRQVARRRYFQEARHQINMGRDVRHADILKEVGIVLAWVHAGQTL